MASPKSEIVGCVSLNQGLYELAEYPTSALKRLERRWTLPEGAQGEVEGEGGEGSLQQL